MTATGTATVTSAPVALLSRPVDSGLPDAGEPLWFLRVNPLPRRRLADRQVVADVAGLLEAEREVARAAQDCSSELYRAVDSTDDPDERRALIALRRAVHHDRPLTSPTDAMPLASVAALTQARARRSSWRAQVMASAAVGLQHERGTLCALLSDDVLRSSLALVAPEVADGAERYCAAVSTGDPLPARLGKSERGLLQYVGRAMLRTSPLSRFTAVGLARAVPGARDLDQVGPQGAVAFPALDRGMLHYVLGGLLASVPDGATMWVQLPPTADVDPVAGRVHFLSLPRAGAAGEAGAPLRRMAAPLTGVVAALVDATAMGPRRGDELVDDLVTRAGVPDGAARAALAQALQVGLLCTSLGPEEVVLDVSAALGDPRLAAPELRAAVGNGLTRLGGVLPPDARRTELARVRSALEELSHAAGRPAAVIVQEDHVLPPTEISTARWRPHLDDLSAAVTLLSAFDRLHDVRALLSSGFVERFGAGGNVGLAEHATALIDDLLRLTSGGPAGGPPPAGPADGSLQRLAALRRRVWDALQAELGRAEQAGTEVGWSASDALAAVADLPDRFRREPLTYGVLVQTAPHGQLVFNDAYAGHGMLFGRFLGADRELGGQALPLLAQRLRAVYGADGRRVVEDAGLHRLNVNAHPPVLDQMGPRDWAGARLVHDRDTDALAVHDVDGRPLRVLNLGAGHPDLLPAPLRLAVWLVCGGRLMEDFVGGWHDATGWDGRRTRRTPQVSIGRVVLARRRWYGGEELERAVASGPGAGERLVALTAWRARHEVPEEVVLTDGPSYDYGRPAQDEDPVRSRRRKPQHLDLASALTARVLPRLADRRQAGHLEQALPGVTHGAHAREWVVEVGHRGAAAPTFGWGVR